MASFFGTYPILRMSTPIIIKNSQVPGKIPGLADIETSELAYNTYDAELYAKRERPGIGTDIVRVSAGTTVTNILYVTKDGKDTNTGRKLGDAKATIAGAIAISEPGTVIKVTSGSYLENNPIKLPKQVSIIGESLREVSVSPLNSDKDLFHVSPGNYISDISFTGSLNAGKAIVAFDPDKVQYYSQSPYIRNCTNFISNSIGLKIDGNHAIGPTKSMVTDSFTQYNQGGIGVSITNEGYAQLVSIFTICPETAIYCGSGGACDLTNSNSSFGNYGLIADGVGPKKYVGVVTQSANANSDTFVLSFDETVLGITTASYDNTTGIATITTSTNHNYTSGMSIVLNGLEFQCLGNPGAGNATYPSGNNGYVFEILSVSSPNKFVTNVGISTTPNQVYVSGGTVKINNVRPFEGQVIYFNSLYYTVSKIRVGNGGSGYTSTPSITISSPSTDWGVTALATAEIQNGSVKSIELVSSGRGYSTPPTITISSPNIGINTATAVLEVLPTYYSILSSTPISAGICTITINENVPYVVGVGTTVPFFKQSKVLASSHAFEYIGSGTTLSSALPSVGGVPIQDNEVDMRNGGLVVYTSTDQSGNFKIGDGVTINQTTGSISGAFYSKSLFTTLTPFILALGGE